MAHYAFLDDNNIVVEVITGIDENEIQPPEVTDWQEWYGEFRGLPCKRTSYNTHGGIHYNPSTGKKSKDQSKSYRYNYAGIGYLFDPDFGSDGAFIPPQPSDDCVLDPETALWVCPEPEPEDVS